MIGIGLAVNLISSVGIIQINKYIYTKMSFSNMCLTCIHFVITLICLIILCWLGVFNFVQVNIKKMLPMSCVFCASVLLTNYSLQFNSIGTYQCFKALSTPGVMIISIYSYQHKYSNKVKISVVSCPFILSIELLIQEQNYSRWTAFFKIPVLLGVFFNSIFDLNFQPFGQFIGISAVIVSSLYVVVNSQVYSYKIWINLLKIKLFLVDCRKTKRA